MAKAEKPASIDPKIEEEANDRLSDARREKAQWSQDYREALWFATPNKARNIESSQAVTMRPKDAAECNISYAAEMAQDFATLIMNTFLPEAEVWAKREPGPDTPPAIVQQVQDKIDEQDAAIFKALKASNFYAEFAKGAVPDLSMGTIGMWVEDRQPWQPIQCQAIPIHELEGALGPFGGPDTTFHVKHTKWRHLRALLPNLSLPADLAVEEKNKQNDRIEVRRGFWRDWSMDDDEYYRYVVMIGKRLVKTELIKGSGSVPLIVGRFNPMPEWFWGDGVLIKALPDLRSLDQLTIDKFEALELGLRPPVSIPDDSMLNFEEGIESGMAYAVRPGSEGAIKQIYEPNPPNAAIYQLQELEQRIKRMFFLDFPEQRGDTPPSATQWLDMVTNAQRRIGTPGLPFWREFGCAIFSRFQYLLEKRGTIKAIDVDGKKVSLVPYNPAQRAAEQQDVAAAARAIEICGPAFPEEFKVAVDGTTTITNFVKILGASKIIAMRKPDDVKQALANIAPLVGGRPGSAPPVGGQPVAPPADAGGVAPAPAQLISRGV